MRQSDCAKTPKHGRRAVTWVPELRCSHRWQGAGIARRQRGDDCRGVALVLHRARHHLLHPYEGCPVLHELRTTAQATEKTLCAPVGGMNCPEFGDCTEPCAMVSRFVSGILWSLLTGGHPSMRSTRGMPADAGERAAHALCSTLLRMGFTEPCGSPRTLVRSYRTVSPSPVTVVIAHGGPSAVSLCCTSVRSPRPGSRQHPALWSPDFPRHVRACTRSCRGHPADSPSRTSV